MGFFQLPGILNSLDSGTPDCPRAGGYTLFALTARSKVDASTELICRIGVVIFCRPGDGGFGT
jgi:hypothetical protein